MKLPGAMDVAGVTRSIATSSAINPTLILSAISVTAGVLLCLFSPTPMNWIGVALCVSPVALCIWQIWRFTLSDPDRLQNDRHVENKLMIQKMPQIAGQGGVIELPLSLPPSDNPFAKRGEQ